MARDAETAAEIAAEAARRAMADAGVKPEDIQLIIVATVTSDMAFPSTACFVQKKIGAANAVCFDISAACSGVHGRSRNPSPHSSTTGRPLMKAMPANSDSRLTGVLTGAARSIRTRGFRTAEAASRPASGDCPGRRH
mgnify:CR=1 FL=1